MGRISSIKLIGVLTLLFSYGHVFGATIVVAPNSSNKSIAKAFDQAKNGDTIKIKQGVYKEGALFLRKALTIIGENYPVIDGEDKYENLFVEHDNVTISGVAFNNSGSSSYNDIAALKINNSKNIIIKNCKFNNNFFAIHTMNSSYVKYLNNELVSGEVPGKPSSNGIHCWKSNHLLIKNNSIRGHRDGVYLEFVTDSKFEYNHSVGNKRYGMHFMFSHDNHFRKNEFRKNGAGVAVMYSKRVTMEENLFAENWGGAAYGLLLKEIMDSHVFSNTFRDNTIAIFADGANRITMENNLFQSNGWALTVNASCADLVVEKNNFIANTFDFATNGKLEAKSIKGNYWDKYEGYDLNRDGVGDVPYRPITFYSIIIERNPGALMLFRSFFVKAMDKAESVLPNLTPENIKDEKPLMKKIKH